MKKKIDFLSLSFLDRGARVVWLLRSRTREGGVVPRPAAPGAGVGPACPRHAAPLRAGIRVAFVSLLSGSGTPGTGPEPTPNPAPATRATIEPFERPFAYYIFGPGTWFLSPGVYRWLQILRVMFFFFFHLSRLHIRTLRVLLQTGPAGAGAPMARALS